MKVAREVPLLPFEPAIFISYKNILCSHQALHLHLTTHKR